MNAKINYQLKLDQIIEQILRDGRKPSVLLHSCCGPCSSYVVTYLKEYFQITVLFYNPNIYPEEEYAHRLSEQARLLGELDVPLLEIGYDHQEYLDYVRGLEAEPEGGRRCEKCFELRLHRTCEIALREHFDYFCTTLSVSPHKNAMVINRVGEETSRSLPGALWLPSDFKKREGYKKSIELSHRYHLYRQNYCGCEWAKQDDAGQE